MKIDKEIDRFIDRLIEVQIEEVRQTVSIIAEQNEDRQLKLQLIILQIYLKFQIWKQIYSQTNRWKKLDRQLDYYKNIRKKTYAQSVRRIEKISEIDSQTNIRI